MDVDPLSDGPPPRYLVESDEEDEHNPLRPESQQPQPPPDVQVICDIASGKPLLVASGPLSAYWARGADLGEQMGGVYVNKIQVGLLFTPSWTQAVVLVSEVTTRLPLWAMRPYAQAVLDKLQPKSTVLLDEYPASSYIADTRILFLDAPLRFLSTSALSSLSAEPFAPPNLVHSASAAFISARAESNADATLVLVPVPHVAPPAPRALAPSTFPIPDNNGPPCIPARLTAAHTLVFSLLGDATPKAWTEPAPAKPTARARKPPTESEFSMYM